MRRVLALVVLALALAGCGGKSADHLLPVAPVHTAKPDPDLVRLKQEAGIRTCAPGTATTSKLPDLTLACLGGGPDVNLKTFRGPMIIDIFQSFCGVCKKELPTLQDFDQAHGATVPVVGIDDQDQNAEAALELAKSSGVTFPLLSDPQGYVDANSPFPRFIGYPYVLFVDASGDIVGAAPGGVTSQDQLVSLTNKYLGTSL